MIARAIARFMLITVSSGLVLGNYWFTYGIWPRSWRAFFLFFTMTFICQVLFVLVGHEAKEGK